MVPVVYHMSKLPGPLPLSPIQSKSLERYLKLQTSGKGVATFLGVTSALYWHIGAGFIASWVFVALIFRYSSLSALLSCLIALALVWKGSQSAIIVSCYLMMVVFIYIKHRENIKNLIAGKEKKIGN